MHLLDLRWYQDKEYGRSIRIPCGTIRTKRRIPMPGRMGEESLCQFWLVVWQYYLVMSEKKPCTGSASCSEKAKGLEDGAAYGNEEDSLLIQYVHQLTEWNTSPATGIFMTFPSTAGIIKIHAFKTWTGGMYIIIWIHWPLRTFAESAVIRRKKRYRKKQKKLRKISWKNVGRRKWFFYDLHYQTDEKHI